MLVFCSFTLSLLKNIYKQPRPSFLFEDIIASSCNLGYGSPSGHGK